MWQLIFYMLGLNIYNDYYYLNQGYGLFLWPFLRYISIISTPILYFLTYKHKGDELSDYFER